MQAFIGRCLFAGVFLSAGLRKLADFDFENGGAMSVHQSGMEGKMDIFLKQFQSVGIPLRVTKDMYPILLFAAILLEMLGSILFILDRRVGAKMLLIFLAATTPIMHQFTDQARQQDDAINFYKNVSLAGALLVYLAAVPPRRRH